MGKIMSEFIRKYTLIIVIVAFAALILQGDLFSSSALVIVGQICAILFSISARVAFGRQQLKVTADPGNGVLIQRGPYKFVRHPMYAAVLLFLWVSIAGHWSIFNAIVGVIATVFAVFRVSVEEKLLREHYPDYNEYALRTKRMIPFLY